MSEHNLLTLLDHGVMVTVNADDPSYFGGYLNDNYHVLAAHLSINEQQVKILASNSFKASFLSDEQKNYWLQQILAY